MEAELAAGLAVSCVARDDIWSVYESWKNEKASAAWIRVLGNEWNLSGLLVGGWVTARQSKYQRKRWKGVSFYVEPLVERGAALAATRFFCMHEALVTQVWLPLAATQEFQMQIFSRFEDHKGENRKTLWNQSGNTRNNHSN